MLGDSTSAWAGSRSVTSRDTRSCRMAHPARPRITSASFRQAERSAREPGNHIRVLLAVDETYRGSAHRPRIQGSRPIEREKLRPVLRRYACQHHSGGTEGRNQRSVRGKLRNRELLACIYEGSPGDIDASIRGRQDGAYACNSSEWIDGTPRPEGAHRHALRVEL